MAQDDTRFVSISDKGKVKTFKPFKLFQLRGRSKCYKFRTTFSYLFTLTREGRDQIVESFLLPSVLVSFILWFRGVPREPEADGFVKSRETVSLNSTTLWDLTFPLFVVRGTRSSHIPWRGTQDQWPLIKTILFICLCLSLSFINDN